MPGLLWSLFVAHGCSHGLCQVGFLVSLCSLTISLLSYFEVMQQAPYSVPNYPLDLVLQHFKEFKKKAQ